MSLVAGNMNLSEIIKPTKCRAKHHAGGQGSAKQQRLVQMFGDERYTDCVIHAGAEGAVEIFRANRTLLARCSMVFGKMLFEQTMRERDGEIHIADCNGSAFRQLLRCSHDLEPEITEANFVEVFQLARKYDVEELLQAARDWMAIASTTPAAALRALDAAECHAGSTVEEELAEVLNCCLQTVLSNGEALLDDSAFLECALPTMLRLLQQECFCCDEERLWLSLTRWVQRQPEGALRSVVPHVRFNVMSPEFFVDKVVPTAVLDDQQVVELLSARVTRRSTPSFPNADMPRCGIVGACWENSRTVLESFECTNQNCTVSRNNYPHWKRALGRWNCDDKMHRGLAARVNATFSVRIEVLVTQKGRYAGDVHIGVAQPHIAQDDHSETRNASVPAWVYCCRDGALLAPNQALEMRVAPIGDGDVMRFELRGSKLYLYRNDEHMGLAFDDVSGPVVPVVEMNLSGSRVTLC